MKYNFLNSMAYEKLMIEEFEDKGYFAYRVKDKTTLGEFLHSHKKGRFAISIPDHVLSYIDGTWYDDESILLYADVYLSARVQYVICEEKYSKYL